MFWIYFDSPLTDSHLQKISGSLLQNGVDNTLEDCDGDILVTSALPHATLETIVGTVVIDSEEFVDFELAEA